MPQQNNGLRVVNVILDYIDSSGNKTEIDINKHGLVDLSFQRFTGTTGSTLPNINLTMFDETGYKLLSMFQSNGGKLRVKYGFENDLSGLYELTIVKYKSTRNNLGTMASIGAFGRQTIRTYGPQAFVFDASVQEILKKMALRNNWDTNNFANISVGDIRLPWPLLLEANETDIEFIRNKILPICNRTVSNASAGQLQYWSVTLYTATSGRVNFSFKKYADRTERRRVWYYSYGADANNSEVITLTDTIDYTFLLNGLYLEVPAKPSEIYGGDDTTVVQYYNNKIMNNWNLIEAMFEEYHLPLPAKDQFALRVKFVPMEEADDDMLVDRIYEAIRAAVTTVNTIEMEVIGNNHIVPTDIVELDVRNKSGFQTLLSGAWKVVLIEEKIGLQGYTTKLSLVREVTPYDTVLTATQRDGGYNNGQ